MHSVMEVLPVVREKKTQNIEEDASQLLNEVLLITDSDGKSSLKLWVLLNSKPDFSTRSLRELIEKGLLKMEIRLRESQRLLKEDGNFTLIESELQVYDLKNESVIQSLKGYGPDPEFRFQTFLNAYECNEAKKALSDIASSIHIKGYMIFMDQETEKGLRFLIPLRNLVNKNFKNLNKGEKESCISIRYFDPSTVNYQDAPRFITNRAIKSRSFGLASTNLIKVKNDLVNPAMVVQPAASKFTLANNPGASLNQKNKLWYLDDIRIKPNTEIQKASLPVIQEDEAVVWMDSVDEKKLWYLPEYKVLKPLLTDPSANSPFLLTFEKIGSDNNGRPVLKGVVKISLSLNIPEAAAIKAKSVAGSKLVPVIIKNQTFILQLPFLDNNGTAKTTDISPSETTVKNNIVELSFQLTNDWIRNCYGVLSIDSFQASKAKIRIYTGFRGLSKVHKSNIKLLLAPDFYKLELVKNNTAAKAAFFDVANRTLNIGDQQLKYPDVVKDRDTKFKLNITNKVALASKASVANTLVVKKDKPPIAEKGEDMAERSFGKEQIVEVFYPCDEFGQFYLEESPAGVPKAIGCFEPYRIGDIQFRMYEEVAAMASPYYKVHRSLQSPDHFLLQPLKYRITRFNATHPEMAFKACVHMYGTLDETEDFQNSFCVLDLCLEPDIPVYEYHLLNKELKKQSNTKPVMEFPGEVAADAVFNWSLPSGTKVTTLNLGRQIQATVTVNIMQVLTLQEMLRNGVLNGQAVYTMADDTRYTVNLNPDTANIIGPWDNGPLEIIRNNASVDFKNPTEKTVQITKIIRSNMEDKDLEIPVNKTLLPGEFASIPITNTQDSIIVDCTSEAKASDLDESWVFIDDLNCQIIFSTDIDFIHRNITGLDLEAIFTDGPLKRNSGQLTSDNPVLEFESFIPITKIAGPRMINYRTRIISSAKVFEFSEWKQWSVKEQGNIINLTSDLLFQP